MSKTVAWLRAEIEGDNEAERHGDLTWRVSPLTGRMGVVVDGWYEIDIEAASPIFHRVDVVAETVTADGERIVRVFTGRTSISPVPPTVPHGYAPIATVGVPCGVTVIGNWQIGAP